MDPNALYTSPPCPSQYALLSVHLRAFCTPFSTHLTCCAPHSPHTPVPVWIPLFWVLYNAPQNYAYHIFHAPQYTAEPDSAPHAPHTPGTLLHPIMPHTPWTSVHPNCITDPRSSTPIHSTPQTHATLLPGNPDLLSTSAQSTP